MMKILINQVSRLARGGFSDVVIPTLFGVEAIVADELTAVGYDRQRITVRDGAVTLSLNNIEEAAFAVARCNVFLASAERVLLRLAIFPTKSFDELFDAVRALDWLDWIQPRAAFTVNGYSRKSRLASVPACQSLIKKAVVDRLLAAGRPYDGGRLIEDASYGEIGIQFALVEDHLDLMVDTSGSGLHKRGYRPLRHQAPLRETLAAAILRVCQFGRRPDEALVDPMCGSGTFLIEAARMIRGIAPGSGRSFAGEKWPFIGPEPFAAAREEARQCRAAAAGRDVPPLLGLDVDDEALHGAAENAGRAGVREIIRWRRSDLRALSLSELRRLTDSQKLLAVVNPPYGERMLDRTQASDLLRCLARLFLDRGRAAPDVRIAVLSDLDDFERIVGGPADKRRKLYNGMIKCMLYQFFRH